MAYVKLEDLKHHLRVEIDADDAYLVALEKVAEVAIANELGKPLVWWTVRGVLPTPLQHAIKLLVGDLYNNRESVAFATPHEVPRSLEYLLQPYRLYNVGTSTDSDTPPSPSPTRSFNRSYDESYS